MSGYPLRNSVLLQRRSSHIRCAGGGGGGAGRGGLRENEREKKGTKGTKVLKSEKDLKSECQGILLTVQQVSITPTTTSILPSLPRTPSLLLLLWRQAQKGCGRDM